MIHIKDLLQKECFNSSVMLNEEFSQGIYTGFNGLDNLLGGIKTGSFLISFTEYAEDNIAFMLNIVKNVINTKPEVKITLFTNVDELELSRSLLRLFAGVAKQPNSKYSFNETNLLENTEEQLAKSQLFFSKLKNGVDDKFLSKIINFNSEEKIDLLVVSNVNYKDCQKLKKLAKELDIVVLALVTNFCDKKLEVKFRGIADVLMSLCFQEQMFWDDDIGKPFKIIVSKNKFGNRGVCNFYMTETLGLFKESCIEKDIYVAIPDKYTPITPYNELKKYISQEHLPLFESLYSEIPKEGELLNLSNVLSLSACLEAIGDHEKAVDVFIKGRKQCYNYEKDAEIAYDWIFAAMYYWLFHDMDNAKRCMNNAKETLDVSSSKEYKELKNRMRCYNPIQWINEDDIKNE